MRNARRLLAALLAVVMLIPSILVPGYAAETTGFKDVREDSWYANAVDYVSAAGYMKGTSKDAFSPGEDVTRAMFVTILSRVARAQTDNTVSAFGDVAANRYYSGAIEWAAEKEIVNGVGGGLFAPYRSITRQDLAVMLYRFVNAMGCELSAGESRTYTDEAAISAYAADAVRFVASTGLFAGYQDGSFRPKATATRAQTAVIVMRLAQLLDGQIVDPEPMPAQSFDQTSEQMQVSVNAPEGALPENTKMTVSRVTDEAALAELASKVGAAVLGAADISFAKDGAELEPARKVSVRISLDALRSARNPAVVHVKDDGSFEYVSSSVVTTRGKADAIEFEADSFSVYAVVGGEGGSHTLTITFYARENGSTGDWKPINKQIIRQDQLTDANNPTPIFDPGVPNISTTESFEGWYLGTASNGSYSESDTGVSVAEINEYWHGATLTGNIERHYYAMVYPVLYVVYHDQNGAVLMTESYHKNGSNQASVTINWPYVPFTEGYTFTGWTPDIDEMGDEPTYSANPTVYQNGQSYTISATLNLYPYVQEGHWITFDNNLARNNTVNGFDDPTTASYTAPVFAASGVNPTQPTNPERPGYTFGGWYANSNLSGSQFNFNTPLTADTTLYAKWTPTTNGTSYMVVFWVQSVSDEVNTSDNHKEYDFGYSEIRTGTACNNAALTISNSGTDADNRRGYNNSSSYRSLVITFNQTNTISKNGWSSVNGTKPIRGDGGTVLNVYYDRRAITYIFADDYNSYYGYTNSRTYSGLYGQPFSEEAFPATGNQFWKCVELNSTINRYINGFTFFDNTNSTYHFVPYTLTGLKNIYEKTQKLNADGTGVLDEYDLKYTYFVTSNGSSSIGSDTFPGFAGYKYNYARDSLTNGANNFPSGTLTVNGSQITGDGAYLYFNRLAYDLDFNSNGTRVRHETVYFEAPLSRFADYVPDNGPRECFFDGWFSDQQLTQKHNLLTATMPNGTKTVFAKWTPKKYRVILNNVSPSDGVTAPSGAQASFLVNGGERIDKDALECFTCNGKRLMGWYTDPEFKHPFNPESLIYDTVSDVNTYYGEKMPGETDAAYNARMNGATRTGTDSITNATWDDTWDTDNPDSYAVQRTVRSQLQLYALWRADPDGVVGMHVTYLGDNLPDTGYFDVTEPTVHPHTWKDPDLYSDHSWAYAQPASVPDRPDDRQFLYWEILDDEGQPTGRKVYPGQTFEILFDDAYQGTEPPTNCEHKDENEASTIVPVAAIAPTCTATGLKAHYRCTLCGRRFTDAAGTEPTTLAAQTVAALGHQWGTPTYEWSATELTYGMNELTCTGTNTCTRDSSHTVTETVTAVFVTEVPADTANAGSGYYQATFASDAFTQQNSASVEIPKINAYVVTFSVPSGVTPPADQQVTPGNAADLTVTPTGTINGYTFLGWVAAEHPTETTDTITALTSYTPNGNATLYALYTRSDVYYQLLTSDPGSYSGDYVITSGTNDSAYMMGVSGTAVNRAQIRNTSGVTLSNSRLRGVPDANVFTFVSDGSGYRLQNKGNNYYVYSSNNSSLTANSTSNTVFTVTYYNSNFYIYYSVYNYYYNYYYYMQYSYNAFSVSQTQAYLYLWQKHETLYYTTAPSVPSGSILEPVQTVEPGQTEEPAVLDLVSFTNPVREGEEQTEYNIFLRAVYGPYNPDATTHIYWYANNGTDDNNGAGERYTSEYTVTENGETTTTPRLPINAQVDIPLPTGNAASQTVFVGDNGGALTWEDHVFLGWARVDNGGTADAAQARILTSDDLYLKWDGSKYLVKNDNGEFVEFNSQKVYADETTPYHDMYAVWAGFYYIYHSSDGSLEAVQVPYDARETKDLVAEAESKNCLYGGYYTGTGAVAAVTAEQMRTAKNAVINAADFWNYATGTAKADASTSLLDAGAVVYNGESIKHTVAGSTVQFWNKAQAYGFGAQADAPSGDQMTPVAGAVYYLKEVPKTFLPNRLVYVKADKNTQLYDGTPIDEGKLTSLYLLTAVDDRNYAENGFMVGTAHSGQTVTSPDGKTGSADTVSRVFTIFVKNGETYSYNANALNPSIGVPQGMNPNLVGFVAAKHLDYEWILAHKGQTDGSNVTFYLKPYWTTLDGVTVTQDNIKGVNITADGKGISFVNVQ